MSRLPIIPTILVLAAVATMIALGVWQLGRADEKAELIARAEAAAASTQPVDFPMEGDGRDRWFRQSELNCQSVTDIDARVGSAATGAKGWGFRAQCVTQQGGAVPVDIGFSRFPEAPEWEGGIVSGVIAPGPRLVADPAVADLEALAKPDPNDLPNNHLAYAGQWFFFALTALVIYGFAVRSRIKRRG